MNTEHESADREMASQVDRLVCAELDESARQTLLAWLEADPVRWRLCGVAFLEAQAWSWVLDDAPGGAPHTATTTSANTGILPPQPRAIRRALLRQAIIAAAILVSFGLGLAFRNFTDSRQPAADTAAGGVPHAAEHSSADSTAAVPTVSAGPSNMPSKQGPVLASFNVETGDSGRFTPIQIPVVPAANDAAHEQEHSEIPAYVRQQWERRGYKVSLERRFMFARLADGRQVVVPVEQVRVNPISLQIN